MSDSLDFAGDVARDASLLIASIRDQQAPDGRLLAFAQRYAVSAECRNDAVLLEVEARVTEEADDLESRGVNERIVGLVQRIANEFDVHRERRAERETMMARLSEHLQHHALPKVDVFVGERLERRHSDSFTLGPITLNLKLGDITGVVGQNGHGKTTLLKLIAGELRPTAGEIHYPAFVRTDKRIDWGRVKREIAFVPQELPPWYGPLRETLHYEAAIHGILNDDNEQAVGSIVARLGLQPHLDKAWNELSGGYKVRFALAKALCWQPRLLVMDEPLANLDVRAKNVFLEDVRAIAGSLSHPIAVILSSHDLHNLESICDQMVFLASGMPRFVGPTGGIGVGMCGEFEIATPLSTAQLRDILADTFVLDVIGESVNHIVRTEAQCKPADLLRLFMERNVPVHYFRDNSRSIRRLFE